MQSYRRPQMSPGLASTLACDIADGITALHACGVVHGDLKPQNVLIFKEGERIVAKLGDFGFSGLIIAQEDIRGQTRKWVAPEYLSRLDGRSKVPEASGDIYSYGLLVTYIWSCGRPLFEGMGGNPADIDAAKRKGSPIILYCQQVMVESFPDPTDVTRKVLELLPQLLHRNPKLRLKSLKGVRQLIRGNEYGSFS
jgi:serine/threonine protein kinase